MKVQTYPLGYLSLLNAKSTGLTPDNVRDDVAPSLEVTRFLLASIPLTSRTVTLAGQTAVGSAVALAVPQGEAWNLVALQAGVTAGTAADPLSYSLSIQPQDLTLGSCAVAWQNPINIVNAGQNFNLPWSAPDGMIVGPGTQFLNTLAITMAHTVTLVIRALYRPLLV